MNTQAAPHDDPARPGAPSPHPGAPPPEPGRFLSAWRQSLRPRTLPLAWAAIAVGSALAARQGRFEPLTALLALATATLLQILANLANDYGDVQKGCDGAARIGPRRGMHSGAISPRQMRRALWLCGLLTAASGGALIARACETPGAAAAFALLGLASIAAALGYTLGRRAYGYLGLGDLSVLVFFGWVGVLGSCWLQTGGWQAAGLLPATASGLFAAAVLNLNNLRDIETDPLAGKITLAVRLGPRRARRYQAALLAGALACLALFAAFHSQGWGGWLFLLALPWLAALARRVLREAGAAAMRPLLGPTVGAVVAAQMLFALGVALD